MEVLWRRLDIRTRLAIPREQLSVESCLKWEGMGIEGAVDGG